MAATEFLTRDLTTYQLPIRINKDEIAASAALLDFGKAGRLDIGALCYLRRAPRQATGEKCRRVNTMSLNEQRTEHIQTLIVNISDMVELGSLRITSLKVEVSYFINFVDWADGAGVGDFFHSIPHAKQVLKGYILYLLERTRLRTIKHISAIHYQNAAVKILETYFESEDIREGIQLLRNNERPEPTTPPDEHDQMKVLSVCRALFDGLSTLTIETQSYPYKLEMPRWLNWEQPYLWIFPTTRWLFAPHELSRRQDLANGHWAYNYDEGTLARPEDIAHHYSTKKNKQLHIAHINVARAHERIAEANADQNHSNRRDAALLAHNAFVLLFVANTGMNWAQVRALPWNDRHSIDPAMQGFRAVKYRANNKLVSFEIGSAFQATFKRFIELRTYLLNGRSFHNLFLGFGANLQADSTPREMAEGTLEHLFKKLKKLDPAIPIVLTRQWRAAKSDHLIRKHDVSTAAIILQNSERTIERSYAAGSETAAIGEMSNFFSRLSSVIVTKSGNSALARSPVGSCNSYGVPLPAQESLGVLPDCQRMIGCLFCEHYRLHADEIDLRKLLSWKYFLNRTAQVTDSVEHFDKLFSGTLERINQLIDEVSDRGHEELIKRLVYEIEVHGELAPYWEAKLNMMQELEII